MNIVYSLEAGGVHVSLLKGVTYSFVRYGTKGEKGKFLRFISFQNATKYYRKKALKITAVKKEAKV